MLAARRDQITDPVYSRFFDGLVHGSFVGPATYGAAGLTGAALAAKHLAKKRKKAKEKTSGAVADELIALARAGGAREEFQAAIDRVAPGFRVIGTPELTEFRAKTAAPAWLNRLGRGMGLLREIPGEPLAPAYSVLRPPSMTQLEDLARTSFTHEGIAHPAVGSPDMTQRMNRIRQTLMREPGGSGPSTHELTTPGKALLGLGGGAAGLAAFDAVNDRRSAAAEKKNAKKGFAQALAQFPELADPAKFDQARLRQNFRVLAKFNPEFAAEPTVAGAFLKHTLKAQDLGVDPVTVGNLVKIRKEYKGTSGDGSTPTALRAAATALGLG